VGRNEGITNVRGGGKKPGEEEHLAKEMKKGKVKTSLDRVD